MIEADPKRWEAVKPSHDKRLLQTVASPVLSIDELSVSRGNRLLIKDLSLSVRSGEVLGIVGDSGCGKSSLGDTLLELIPAHSGTITRHSLAAPWRWLKLYQDPTAAITHSVSLRTLLDDMVKLYKIKNYEIARLMECLNIGNELLQRSASNVSGGELQRFCLLRVLLLKPVFLFADEPTSRLDSITAKDISALLVEMAK